MTNDFVVKSDGFAFEVPSSHKFRFELIEGQQILDVHIWCKEQPTKEFLSECIRPCLLMVVKSQKVLYYTRTI